MHLLSSILSVSSLNGCLRYHRFSVTTHWLEKAFFPPQKLYGEIEATKIFPCSGVTYIIRLFDLQVCMNMGKIISILIIDTVIFLFYTQADVNQSWASPIE